MLIYLPQRSSCLQHLMFANQGSLYAKQGDCGNLAIIGKLVCKTM
jgi:hypothetical protein